MKFLKNVSYLLFITLFLSSCDNDDDSVSGSLVGQWNWVSTTTTVTNDDDGSVSEQTDVPTEDNDWTLTFNDNNTFTQILCCHDDDDDGYNDDYTQSGGTWFAESGILTISVDDDNDGVYDVSFQLDYVLSNESNTLTMTQYIDVYNEDDDGYWSNSAVQVIILNRAE